MRLALIQEKQNELYNFDDPNACFSLDQAKHLQLKMIQQNLEMLHYAAEKNCDLMVTSEAINFCGQPNGLQTKYHEILQEEWLEQELSRIAKNARAYLVAGVYRKEGDRIYNAALVFDRNGKRIHVYNKTHLAGGEKEYLCPGDQLLCFSADFGKVGVCICWDMQIPEVCRSLALAGAQIVVCPTWGWESTYSTARAYENGIIVASAMAVPYHSKIEGIRLPSEVIGQNGEILARASFERKEVLLCDLDLHSVDRERVFRIGQRRPELYHCLTL